METQEKSLNEIIVSQLNALSLRLDRSYFVVEFFGNPKLLELSSISLGQDLLKDLPQSIAQNLNENLKKNLRNNKTQRVDVSYVNKNNVRKRLQIVSDIVDAYEEAYYVITIMPQPILEEDTVRISNGYESYEEARRQLEFSENRYNSFFENDPVMHISVNPNNGLVVDCNKFFVNRLGYETKNEIIGKPVYSIFTPDKRERCLFLVEKFKEEGQLDSEEMELLTKKGGAVPVILYTTAQYDEEGNILFSRSTLVDISELKNTQKRLNQKRMRLENMNTELEQFVSTCSHDLQEPLATIKFANDLIGKLYGNKLDEKGHSYVRYVNEAVDRLTSQIRSLLSHIRLGQNAERTTIDTNELVSVVIKDLGRSITNSRAKIKVVKPLPTIKAYQVELRLLFQNLLSNAIKYRKKGRVPKIEISSFSDREYVYFSIKDNGIGISKLDQTEIFKIFNRVNDNSPHKGDGVGLAHCKKIVRMHEGDICVESEVEMGSTFTFKLKKNYLL